MTREAVTAYGGVIRRLEQVDSITFVLLEPLPCDSSEYTERAIAGLLDPEIYEGRIVDISEIQTGLLNKTITQRIETSDPDIQYEQVIAFGALQTHIARARYKSGRPPA